MLLNCLEVTTEGEEDGNGKYRNSELKHGTYHLSCMLKKYFTELEVQILWFTKSGILLVDKCQFKVKVYQLLLTRNFASIFTEGNDSLWML